MTPSEEWDPLGNTDAFYRRTNLYALTWTFPGGDLSDYVLVGARNGGPVALIRDESKPVLVKDASAMSGKTKRIWVYSCAGTLLQSITWDHASKIVKLGFTQNESLVVLARDGTYRLYPIASISSTTSSSLVLDYTQHSLAHDLQEATVSDACIYEAGMVILLSTHQFLEVKGWPEKSLSPNSTEGAASDATSGRGSVERFVDTALEKGPHTWCILSSDQSTSRQTEVLLSSSDALLSVDSVELQVQRFSPGPFSHIVPSPSGRFIAFLTASKPRKVMVVSSNYSDTLSEYLLTEPSDQEAPKAVYWCGNNSVVLIWHSRLLMVGPYGQVLRYFYVDPIQCINEIDGLRILSADKCEFLQKVPASTVAVFQPGSVHPSAILYEAFEEFNAKNAHAHSSIMNIKLDLVEAVDTLIDAAAQEFDSTWQRKLLKAASFGKSFLDLFNANDFVSMSQTLRVLNAVRYYDIAIPLSYEQYRTKAPQTLIQRLTLRGHHLLALRIASYLKLSVAPILRHWAQVQVSKSKGDQEEAIKICNVIVKRLNEERERAGALDVSCADVARTAWEEGKTALATKLLDHEPRASKQVHLLLRMKEDNLALSKASRSGDSDLILAVLLILRKKHSLGNFFRFLDNKDEAQAILASYGKRYDKELVRDFWFQDDRRTETACFSLEEAAAIGFSAKRGSSDVPDVLPPEQFSEKMDLIRKAQKSFGEDRDRGFEAKICEDYARLLAFQQTLQAEVDSSAHVSFVGLSVNDTIRQCIIRGLPKKAEKVRTDWKVPEKRWWHIKLKALVEIRDFEQLEIFSKSKGRPPIGFEPIVETLVSHGHSRQALTYIPKCDPRFRADLYVKAGDWIKAGEECRDKGDRNKLNDLVARAPNNLIAAQLNSLLEETHSRGF